MGVISITLNMQQLLIIFNKAMFALPEDKSVKRSLLLNVNSFKDKPTLVNSKPLPFQQSAQQY